MKVGNHVSSVVGIRIIAGLQNSAKRNSLPIGFRSLPSAAMLLHYLWFTVVIGKFFVNSNFAAEEDYCGFLLQNDNYCGICENIFSNSAIIKHAELKKNDFFFYIYMYEKSLITLLKEY